jgi:acyl transferase domain-containing protein
MAMQNRTVPPNMHFHSLNEKIVPFYNGLQVPTTLQRWPKPSNESPLRASVNSFGFGGTNAHALLESYESPPTELESRMESTGDFDSSGVVPPLLFSADSEKALCATVQRYLEYLSARPSVNFRDLAWTLQSRRSVLPVKVVFTGSSREDVMEQIEARLSLALSTPSTPLGVRSQSNTATPKKILGVFTGQGAQWASMSRELVLHSRRFAEIIHDLEQALSDLPDAPDWSLRNELLAPDGVSRLHEAAISQPLCTAIQVALVDLLRCARIDFGAVVGHSSGEIAAVSSHVLAASSS